MIPLITVVTTNEMMTDYFIKIALSNGLKRFKSTIPKTKKQALRSKIQTVQHITKDKKNELSVNDAKALSER
jgi:thiamine monophosphate synthase